MQTFLRNQRYQFSAQAGPGFQDFGFDAFLFVEAAHLKTQSEDKLLTFQLRDLKSNKIVAHLPVFINQNRQIQSPGRAPFGGPQFAQELPATVIAEFVSRVRDYLLQTENASEIKLKSCPLAFAPATNALLTNALLRIGFQVELSEISHHIPVAEVPLENRLHASARRRLHKCQRNGFTFQQEEAELLPEIFWFIEQCRAEKKYPLSLNLPETTSLFNQFPDSFLIFTVRTSTQELAAATIAVRINAEILYNFYPASPQKFNTFSPTILLTEGLYQVCQQQGFQILDLGTSMLGQKPNFPLIAFKKHLGGEAGLKLTFSYSPEN